MTDANRTLADQVDADIQEAVDTLIDSARITMLLARLSRRQLREILIQSARVEAQLLAHEGVADVPDQLNRVVDSMRVIQPEVVATGQGPI